MKRLFPFFCLFFLCACAFRVPKDPHTFVLSLGTDPDRLNPIVTNSAYALTVSGYLFEQMINLDNTTLKPKPWLAKRWEISEDHRQYTFYLREDVRWHDGKPLTAEDVLFSHQLIMDPKADAGPSRSYHQAVEKGEVLGPHTVRFTLKEPYVGGIITLGLMPIVPKHILNDGRDINTHPFNRRPVGTGPFRFAEWKTGRRIALERNDDYWGDPYAFRRIVFRMIPDQTARFQLFKKREIDLIDLNAIQWARQTDTPAFRQKSAKHKLINRFGGYSYLGWNLSNALFKDKRVRWALAHLVDRGEINHKLLFDLYFPVTGPYYPFGPNYNKSLRLIEYNPRRADELLGAAGWKDHDGDGIRDKNGKPFRFTLIFVAGLPYYEQLTPILQRNFAKAGIRLDLRRLEGAALFKIMSERTFDAYLAGWGRGAGEEDLLQVFHSSQIQGGSNHVGYANPEADRLLEEGRRTFDDAERTAMYREVHRLIYEDQPYLFFFASPDLVARDRRFTNVKEYPAGLELREWRVEAEEVD